MHHMPKCNTKCNTECNIVLPFLTSADIVSKRMHVSSHFLVILHHSRFLTPTAVTKFQLEPLNGGFKYIGWEIFFIIFNGNCHLPWKRYKIGLWLSWKTNRNSRSLKVIRTD